MVCTGTTVKDTNDAVDAKNGLEGQSDCTRDAIPHTEMMEARDGTHSSEADSVSADEKPCASDVFDSTAPLEHDAAGGRAL